MIIRVSKSKKLILAYILTAVVLCLFIGTGLVSMQKYEIYDRINNASEVSNSTESSNASEASDASDERPFAGSQQISISEAFAYPGIAGRIFHEQVAEKVLSSDFCMQKIGSTYVSMASILQKLAGILFTYTCASILLFLADRIPRLYQILFIHRSDGQKSHKLSFIF